MGNTVIAKDDVPKYPENFYLWPQGGSIHKGIAQLAFVNLLC